MSAVGVGSKYHCAINGVGYLIAEYGYRKQDANVLVSRFATGEPGLGDLDLFKTFGQTDLSGGSFQQAFDDPTKFSLIKNMIFNRYDKLLYTTPTSSDISMSSYTAWRSLLCRSVVFRGELYFAANGLGSVASGYGAVYKYDPSTDTITSVKTNFAGAVLDLAVLSDRLWVSCGSAGTYTYDGSTFTLNASFGPTLLKPFMGSMYANGYTGNGVGTLYISNPTLTVRSTIGAVGDTEIAFNSMEVFNSRLYIGKPDGLFVYDGVQTACVWDTSRDLSSSNFLFLASHNGVLYFVYRNSVYSFNGASIEEVRRFANYEQIVYLGTANGRLVCATKILKVSSDKGGAVGDSLFYSFDGVGWFLYHAVTGTSTYATPFGFMYLGTTDGKKKFIEMFVDSSGFSQVQLKVINMANEYAAVANNVGEIITSEIDCDFPSIDKFLDSISVDYENIGSSDSIAVSYKAFDGSSWSAWLSLGTITSTTSRTVRLWKTSLSGVFKKIQVKITVTRDAASTLAIRDYYMNYYLSPDRTWLWQVKLQCMGNSETPLVLLDETTETKTPAQLRDNLYNANNSDSPVGFEDVDFTRLTGAHNNSTTTLTVGSTYGMRTSGFVKIGDEIIYYTGKTSTTLTGCTRAALGTTAASHSDQDYVNVYYRVVVKELPSETIDVPSQDALGQESQITLLLQEAPSG
jgi:hypothetical protein